MINTMMMNIMMKKEKQMEKEILKEIQGKRIITRLQINKPRNFGDSSILIKTMRILIMNYLMSKTQQNRFLRKQQNWGDLLKQEVWKSYEYMRTVGRKKKQMNLEKN